ncbi:MAG: glycosyltransferase family 9 protein [Candidatus Binatia bacterium]
MSGSRSIPKKNLAIFPGALGDFICFLPALEKIARVGGLDLLARTEYGDLLPQTITTRSVERYEISRLFVPGTEGDERLKSFYRSYAFIYSWMGSSQPDFVKNLKILSGNRLRIFPFRSSNSRLPMVDYYLSCLGEGHPREIFPDIPLRSDALSWIQGLWRQSGLQERRILVLAPGSGAAEKNWPIQFYKVVAEWWEKRFGKVIVLLGPIEEERGESGNHWDHALVLCGLELAKVAALLPQCDLYLGNDSGVTHLAAALGVETVALFGPTDPAQWAPRGKRVTVVSRNVECSPCIHSVMKACPHRKCLTTLNPVDVIGKLEEVWGDGEQQRSPP